MSAITVTELVQLTERQTSRVGWQSLIDKCLVPIHRGTLWFLRGLTRRFLVKVATDARHDALLFRGALATIGERDDFIDEDGALQAALERIEASLLRARGHLLDGARYRRAANAPADLQRAFDDAVVAVTEAYEAATAFKWAVLELAADNAGRGAAAVASTPEEVDAILSKL